MVDKPILVTGGAGFLGSHLCDRLIAAGHEVLCVDNFYTGARRNIAHLLGRPNFELCRHDVTFPLYVEVGQIYNLACPASPVHYQFDPVQTTKTSVHGAINMLGLAKRVRARLLQASTSEVYGDPEVHPQREGYWGRVNPVGIRSCYDEGKRCAETLMFDYHRQHGLEIKVVRIFNTYGPRMHPNDGRVVSNFIVQALKGESITIYGSGQQTRSFCYVDDLIEGMMRMMGSPADMVGPVNIGNPGEFTMLELAELVLKLTGSRSKLVFQPLPEDDPRQRCPDIGLAREKLGWAPTVSLADGLVPTIAYFREALQTFAGAPPRARLTDTTERVG
ncbi:UDP-glucuronic acid decarboxylase family protein [Rhodoplanes roseus]|uniref:NAD-dependent dehydratase n=1 Tax=Rhodoplanes roseus TaxID=29409 RepID=A0A327KXU3_9BRAD|nr:UDP-glucuronic acid decarboxylase family protein [Rhodoplanes roseus]RAI43659.1 NAD-dependent dehydratase [Rhodoplanes roseus]